MFDQFKNNFAIDDDKWTEYSNCFKRMQVPAKTVLLREGDIAKKLFLIEKGCIRAAENLRSVDLILSGSGLGSWTSDEMNKLFTEIIPEMFELAANGKLKVDTVDVNLRDIENLWNIEVPGGKRLVIRI